MSLIEGKRLYDHVRRFATAFGPRPAGSPNETAAREVLKDYLHQHGIHQTTHLPFSTTNTWGYGLIAPLILALIPQCIPHTNRYLRTAVSLLSLQQSWLALNGQMRYQPLYRLYPQYPGGTLIARIPAAQTPKHTVVLVGHTDSNKHRPTFSPELKRYLRLASTSIHVAMLGNVIASLLDEPRSRLTTTAYMLFSLVSLIGDELGPYVEGANDNGSAMACVLGLGEQALATPLNSTEIWLAFTGSEEVSHDGLNVMLDHYGAQLQDAYWIDFEMVGKGSIHFVEQYHGLSYLVKCQPDADTLHLAQTVAAKHPELQVSGSEPLIYDEVATLRRRGFRGITLVGLDSDGYLGNWHQRTDTIENIEPHALERAAQFAWHMIKHLDQQ